MFTPLRVYLQAVAYIPPHQPHLVQAMIRWTAATMWAVKSMVRPKSPLKDELQGMSTAGSSGVVQAKGRATPINKHILQAATSSNTSGAVQACC